MAHSLHCSNGVQIGYALPPRTWERGLSMDSGGGYAAVIVVVVLVFIATWLR
jgi:hypothetical protein